MRPTKPQTRPGTGSAAQPLRVSEPVTATYGTLEAATLKVLSHRAGSSSRHKALEADMAPTSEIVRLRPKGGADRRIKVDYLPDPDHPGSVLMRLTPLSEAPLPASNPELLSTQAAANLLGVSRPYVAKLVDANVFKGVVRTHSNHRRIPMAEVERVKASMANTRRQALDELNTLDADLRQRELDEARLHPIPRWVRRQP